jgi:antitoxin HigA-1
MRLIRPAHPGRFIRTEVIEPLGLSVTKAAEVLGVIGQGRGAYTNFVEARDSEVDSCRLGS